MRLYPRFFQGCRVRATSIGVVGLVALAGAAVEACELHNPVPVTPDYPPPPPFKTGDGGTDGGK